MPTIEFTVLSVQHGKPGLSQQRVGMPIASVQGWMEMPDGKLRIITKFGQFDTADMTADQLREAFGG